jgi:pyridoxamine 5'-phosphate oxidase
MAATSQAAPWRGLFSSHLKDITSPTFTLTTIAYVNNLPEPRARTCVFRNFWADVPSHPQNKAPSNPSLYTSDMPIITTDVRMRKVTELFHSRPKLGADTGTDTISSGGGGPVEGVWWFEKTKTQWRIKGDAWIVGPDIDGSTAVVEETRSKLLERMRTEKEGNKEDWSWAKELDYVFGGQSPASKGFFRQPMPGGPRDVEPPKGYGLGQKIDDVHDDIARANFRVVVIRPFEVELVDLSNPSDGKRRTWKYQNDGSWTEKELWP